MIRGLECEIKMEKSSVVSWKKKQKEDLNYFLVGLAFEFELGGMLVAKLMEKEKVWCFPRLVPLQFGLDN